VCFWRFHNYVYKNRFSSLMSLGKITQAINATQASQPRGCSTKAESGSKGDRAVSNVGKLIEDLSFLWYITNNTHSKAL